MLFKVQGSCVVDFEGVVEADSIEEAEQLAEENENYLSFQIVDNDLPSLGDIYDIEETDEL